MDKFDRIYALHKLLSAARYPISRLQIERSLECKRGTIVRIISYMQDFLGAPLEYDPQANGWYYNHKATDPPYELPGLWFNTQELQSLAILSQLLDDLQPGILSEQLRPFEKRIETLLASKQFGHGEIKKSIRLLGIGVRSGGDAFQQVAEGVLQNRQIQITYHTRESNQISQRIVSPQRIVRYRDNWYLDAYCHQREALRNFAIDRIKQIKLLSTPAIQIDSKILSDHFADAYGIFAGKSNNIAVLIFNEYRARWVAEETWHPKQQARFLTDGRYELKIPYRKPQELLMDILKYGPDVDVVAPEELRQAVKVRLEQAVNQYK